MRRNHETPDFVIDGFFHVDSKPAGDGAEDPRLEEIRHAIARSAAALPEMGHEFPAGWTGFRRRLTPSQLPGSDDGAARRPYLRFHELVAEAIDDNVARDDVGTLTRIAAGRGQWIRLGDRYDDPTDDELIVTQPEWLAKAIAFVLNDETTRLANGIVSRRRMSELWADPAHARSYPDEVHDSFIELMERFDLIYELAQSADEFDQYGRRWLVAQLVADTPDHGRLEQARRRASGLSSRQVIEFVDQQGRSVSVPDGLLYRLIVRFHRFSLGSRDHREALHWKRGVVFRHDLYGDTEISVEENRLLLVATGVRPEPFLSMLADDVGAIVERFWQGIRVSMAAVCGDHCPSGRGNGVFPIDKLLSAKRDNRSEFPCRAQDCDGWLDIELLLAGASRPSDPVADHVDTQAFSRHLEQVEERLDAGIERRFDEAERNAELRFRATLGRIGALESGVRLVRGDIVEELIPYVGEGFDRLRGDVAGLDDRMRGLGAQANEHLDTFMAALGSSALDGPTLISASDADRGVVDRAWAERKLELVLWCEHSMLPLSELRGLPDSGRYVVRVRRATLVKVLPLLSLATKVAAGFVPIAAIGADSPIDAAAFRRIRADMNGAVASLDGVSRALGLDQDTAVGATDSRAGQTLDQLVTTEELRLVRDQIRQQDPLFAGLKRVEDKQRNIRWVDERFAALY